MELDGRRGEPDFGGGTWGNQREKLYMTIAAMSVLPRPVGRHTSVFCSSADWIISSWYPRAGVPCG